YTPALMAQAAAASHHGDNNGAISRYTRILQRWPDFAPAQKRLAAIYAQDSANTDIAYELANKARRSLPNDSALARTIGVLSYRRKDYGRAIQFLRESDATKPLDAQSVFYLGMAQLQAGSKVEAKRALQRAVNAGLSGEEAQEARQVIAGLEKSAPKE